ncbi:hypothetical protein [Pseudonocardia sp. HH130629-09]|uniref:hypothetical protein n=1 Tax=Pseudonocardia sp. HH130629-09 TaxID=1641402 RepID=UPI000B2A01A6|nr:hypothetical protein [Pseudonocardia sp. HH130629-09]
MSCQWSTAEFGGVRPTRHPVRRGHHPRRHRERRPARPRPARPRRRRDDHRPVRHHGLQDTVGSLVAQNAGVPIDATTCDGDLAPATGQAVGCRVTSGQDSIDVRATVTEIQGGLVNFDVEQV